MQIPSSDLRTPSPSRADQHRPPALPSRAPETARVHQCARPNQPARRTLARIHLALPHQRRPPQRCRPARGSTDHHQPLGLAGLRIPACLRLPQHPRPLPAPTARMVLTPPQPHDRAVVDRSRHASDATRGDHQATAPAPHRTQPTSLHHETTIRTERTARTPSALGPFTSARSSCDLRQLPVQSQSVSV